MIKIPAAGLRIGDVILCITVAITAVLLLLIPFLGYSPAAQVEIKYDGGNDVYQLSDNREVQIESNSHKLTVRIEDGKVYVSSADCPDKLCVNMGEISRSGEAVICVPAQVVVKIVGESEVDYALR